MLKEIINTLIICGAASAAAIAMYRSWLHYKIPPLCQETFNDIRGDITENKKKIEKNAVEIKSLRDDTGKLFASVAVIDSQLKEKLELFQALLLQFERLYKEVRKTSSRKKRK